MVSIFREVLCASFEPQVLLGPRTAILLNNGVLITTSRRESEVHYGNFITTIKRCCRWLCVLGDSFSVQCSGQLFQYVAFGATLSVCSVRGDSFNVQCSGRHTNHFATIGLCATYSSLLDTGDRSVGTHTVVWTL